MEFDPKNRRKIFHKKVTVETNGTPSQLVLRVKGFVIPDPTALRKRIGQLQINRAEFNFGNVFDTEVKRDSIMFRNDSNHDMELDIDLSTKPENIDIYLEEEVVPPGEMGMIMAVFEGVKGGTYGFQRFRAGFNDKAYPDSTRGQLIITYNQQEDFSGLTPEEKANAPRIKFDDKTCDFGRKRYGEDLICEFTFTNTGKSPLKIRHIRLPSHVSEKESDRLVMPGEKGKIILSADTSRMSGEMIRYVHVTTNCPNSTRVRLTIRGKVID